MKILSITVEGNPLGWQRTGYNRFTGAKYVPPQTREREDLIAATWREETNGYMYPDESYIAMKIKAYFAIPKSAPKAKREEMNKGIIRPSRKPDGDNIYKLVADALNQVAYTDDSHVVFGTFEKYYSEYPRTEITLYDLGE